MLGKSRTWVLLAAVLLVGSAAAGESGRLMVRTEPPGAQIFIDLGVAGVSEVTRSLAPRDYYVEAHWPDGATKSVTAHVAAGADTQVVLARGGASPTPSPSPATPTPTEPATPPPVARASVVEQPAPEPVVAVAPTAAPEENAPVVERATPPEAGPPEEAPLDEGAPMEPLDDEELNEKPPPEKGPKARYTPFDLTLYSNAGIFGWYGKQRVVTGFEFNLLYSHTRAFYGIGIGGFSRVDRDFGGFAFNVVANLVEKNAYGFQLSLWLNRVHGDFIGFQFGVGKNVVTGARAAGIQLAVLKNEVLADFTGMQIAAFVNETSGRTFHGIQAGLVNWSEAEVYEGMQISTVNLVWGGFRGVQMGAVNIVQQTDRQVDPNFPEYHPYGDMSGAQIGVVNIGGWVRGMQIGAFNYASSLTGVQYGLINIAKKGGVIFMPIMNVGIARAR